MTELLIISVPDCEVTWCRTFHEFGNNVCSLVGWIGELMGVMLLVSVVRQG